jgi:Tfp pilus assembly protein PilF
MTIASNYCHQCEKPLPDNSNIHNNFCSWNCQQKYTAEREKWERLKAENDKRKKTS